MVYSRSKYNKRAKERRIKKTKKNTATTLFRSVRAAEVEGHFTRNGRLSLFPLPAAACSVDIITVHVSPAAADWLRELGSTEGDWRRVSGSGGMRFRLGRLRGTTFATFALQFFLNERADQQKRRRVVVFSSLLCEIPVFYH